MNIDVPHVRQSRALKTAFYMIYFGIFVLFATHMYFVMKVYEGTEIPVQETGNVVPYPMHGSNYFITVQHAEWIETTAIVAWLIPVAIGLAWLKIYFSGRFRGWFH